MENWLRRRLGSGEANCEWSLVYVSLAAGTCVLLVLVCCCLTTCKRKVVKMRAKRKYTRLSTADNIEMNQAMKVDTFDEETETDSEEEILFESSKKGRRPNGSVPNGYIKNGKLNT